MFLKNVSIFKFFARQFPYFAPSVTPWSLCHGNNIAQMPTIRTPGGGTKDGQGAAQGAQGHCPRCDNADTEWKKKINYHVHQ